MLERVAACLAQQQEDEQRLQLPWARDTRSYSKLLPSRGDVEVAWPSTGGGRSSGTAPRGGYSAKNKKYRRGVSVSLLVARLERGAKS